jgi:hypothetical protein
MAADNANDRPPYDYRNCQSLFGYAAQVHARSGAACQLCGFGGTRIDFDAWRQLTVEHLIGDSQGGYPPAIREAVAARYPELPASRALELADQIDVANTVTACQFCNATTSRNRAPISMHDLIRSAPCDPEGLLAQVVPELQTILAAKRAEVMWKLTAVREAYEKLVLPTLDHGRDRLTATDSDANSPLV